MKVERSKPYRVAETEDDRFVVIYGEDLQIASVRDRHSAEHYAVLCNEAFRRGYKTGYKDARQGIAPP